MRLPKAIVEKVKRNGIEVYFADRRTTKTWNKGKLRGEPSMYGGWYWMRTTKGKVIATDEDGPFRTESAAIRDAFLKLQLR